MTNAEFAEVLPDLVGILRLIEREAAQGDPDHTTATAQRLVLPLSIQSCYCLLACLEIDTSDLGHYNGIEPDLMRERLTWSVEAMRDRIGERERDRVVASLASGEGLGRVRGFLKFAGWEQARAHLKDWYAETLAAWSSRARRNQ